MEESPPLNGGELSNSENIGEQLMKIKTEKLVAVLLQILGKESIKIFKIFAGSRTKEQLPERVFEEFEEFHKIIKGSAMRLPLDGLTEEATIGFRGNPILKQRTNFTSDEEYVAYCHGLTMGVYLIHKEIVNANKERPDAATQAFINFFG